MTEGGTDNKKDADQASHLLARPWEGRGWEREGLSEEGKKEQRFAFDG